MEWGKGEGTSLQARAPTLPPTTNPKKNQLKTGPKFYHKQDHGGSTHNGPIKQYPEGPAFVVAMTYTKLSIFQYEIVGVPTLRENF